MADRVHPKDSPIADPPETAPLQPKPASPVPSSKPVPPPGTYVVQIPKDQIYRYPPPENAARYRNNLRRKKSRSCCCCCFCWFLGLLTLLIVLLAIAGAVFYLVFRPAAPKYSVEKISIKGFNLTAAAASPVNLSPEFDITVRAENPNNKIGIYYTKGSSVSISHSGNQLCAGVLPAFFQPKNNVTMFQTALTSTGKVLTSGDFKTLRDQQRRGQIPLELALKVPVKIRAGSFKTWKITVKVNCKITVDKLGMDASIVSKNCDVDAKPW